MNEISQSFLDTYARGSEIEGGWKFAKALQQAQLDYSDEGLDRLDQLLLAIKSRAKPSREDMLVSLPGQNFCALIAFHVIDIARRRSGATIDWHDRESALRAMPAGAKLPDASFARLVAQCSDQGVVFMPLGWLEAQLFDDSQAFKARDYLASMMSDLERDGPAIWWTATYQLGWIASMQMMLAADGASVMPTMMSSTAPQSLLSLAGDVDAALMRGAKTLEQNPDGATWQLLSYDGIAELERGRFDALMLVLRTYGESPLQLKIAFPYRPAAPGRSFEILDPTLRESNVSNETIAKLSIAMERGIQAVNWVFGTSWNQLRK
ncbi:MAG: hypothetical protein V4582_14405 [Pseudomonadota bacterium]